MSPFRKWLRRQPSAPLLHFTGLSGAGKSSLLAAYLAPELAKSAPPARLVIIRTFDDPLSALMGGLAAALWKKQPDDWEMLTPAAALDRAVEKASQRLIIVLDQFEEFFLLGTETRGGDASPVLPPDAPRVAALAGFLRDFLADPPRRVTLVLSYREDHAALLDALGLPARTEGANWKRLDPLRCEQARAFLTGVRTFEIPADRLQRVLAEAVGYERDKVFVRPIVVNMLGLVLELMKDHPTFWKYRGDLLRHYVRLKLGRELVTERAKILRKMITDFQTARSRSVTELDAESDLTPAILANQLENLAHDGLVRCLSDDRTPTVERKWQITHDFVATLIERVFDGLHRTLWRTFRPWLAPAAVGLALMLGVIWPWVEKQRAISFLANKGFTWNEGKAEIVAATAEAKEIEDLDRLVGALHLLRPRSLELLGCNALQNCDGLRDLTSIRDLRVGGYTIPANEKLRKIDAMSGLVGLQHLAVWSCAALENIDGLKGLTALESIDLMSCDALQNIDGLKGHPALKTLHLNGCPALETADVLKGFTSLRSFSLYSWDKLKDLDFLKGFSSLESLALIDCRNLQNLDGLKGLPLKSLYLTGCKSLRDVDVLKGLTSLQNLMLIECDGLPKESWPALKAALPTTHISFPDRSEAGPP